MVEESLLGQSPSQHPLSLHKVNPIRPVKDGKQRMNTES